VTFAGSPGRAEAQLVPDAGYELDTFEIAGFPRRPSAALAHSLLLAAKAPLACRAILSRRRPDVVLGGGGYVAGPMVLAAATMRTPAALMEADVHLGLANRLALPFAQRVFLATEIPGREGGKYRVTGRPVPAGSRPVDRGEARRLFELPTDGPVLLVYGGSQGARSLNELAVQSFGADGRTSCTWPASATSRHCGGGLIEAATDCCPTRTSSGPRLPRRISLSRARAARSTSSRPPASRLFSFPIRRQPATTRRRTRGSSSAPAPRSSFPSPSSQSCPISCAACSRTQGDWRRCVRRCSGSPVHMPRTRSPRR
jgi:hypothetical protein